MTEINSPIPEKETQPALFLPDGTPNPEVVQTLKKIEDEINGEYFRQLDEEIQFRAEERRYNHAP